ncbi:LPXTG cell wall anchor domain-containing protein [Lentzea rhizosphaerae]|uniref:LPXTG cell wall anchor domain-containing protein n=1 Tax=Lentzea rhizosphaerae TaxID=2041025 RepID=A0ABV8C2D3_9PSEU
MASRVLGAFVVAGTAVLTSLALATPAFAHTPTVNVDCDEAAKQSVLSVELRDYNTRKGQNTLTVEIDGKQVEQIKFDNGLPTKKWPTTSTEDHTYKVTVRASDDPDIENQNPYWSRVFTLDNKKCVKTPPATTTKPVKQVTTTTEAPSTSAPSSTTPTAPAPGGSTPEPPLAATGASPMWLLLSGLGLVGAGAGTLLFLRRRRSA